MKRNRTWPWVVIVVFLLPPAFLIGYNWSYVKYLLRDYPFFGDEFRMIDPSKEIMHIKIGEYVADIPSNYFWRNYVFRGVWWHAPSKLLEGDVVNLEVTWPELKPWSLETDKLFREPGTPETISVSLRKIRNEDWPFHYFKNVRERLKVMPESNAAPDLLHFVDMLSRQDVFLEFDDPRYGMFRLLCHLENDGVPSPMCECTDSVYRDKFIISYHFSRNYLSEWRRIDMRLKEMFDLFMVADR